MSTILERLEPQVREALEEGHLESLREILAEEHPADISDVLERLEPDQRYEVFQLLDIETQAEVLDRVGQDATRELFVRLPVEEAADLLDELPMDDAVEILTEDVPELKDQLLAAMETEDAAEVQRLMQYPPESAGLLMTEKYVHVGKDLTAAEALQYLQRVDEEVETVSDLYVLDDDNKLIGVFSLRELLRQRPDTRIEEFMETDIVFVLPETDQETVARTVAHYHFMGIPVVDENQIMLGIITVDDVIDVLVEENTEDILRFGAVESDGTDQPYFTIPLFRVLRSRFGWLLLLMVADTLTGTVLRLFDAQLAAVVQLSFYIPLLIGTGGNTGSQTVSTIIRGLAVRDIRFGDIFRVLRRELMGGLLLGIGLSIVAGTRAYIWDGNILLAVTVGFSIVAICTWANVIGALIPMIAHRVGIDAAVVSAPMISTLVDATGLFIYLTIAGLFLAGQMA
ncbi:MAG: magnesium transporter [Anaerolineaceae bacterium]|nr:magnesium transporter [Anaerolineaceae bacterium]